MSVEFPGWAAKKVQICLNVFLNIFMVGKTVQQQVQGSKPLKTFSKTMSVEFPGWAAKKVQRCLNFFMNFFMTD